MNEAVVPAQSAPAVKRIDKQIARQEEASYARLRDEVLDALFEYRRCVNNFDYISDEKLIDV